MTPLLPVGISMFVTDVSIGPAELARAAEDRGFDSLFVPEHTHIPVSRRTPYPMGEPIPDEYKRTLDPFVALTAAAAATERLVVGTGICLVAQHHPINLAKATASLDHVSNGRFVFGVGFGWNHDEMEDHGVDPKHRRAKAREHVLAIRSLWQDDEAGFDGEHVRVPPTWSWPKPVQRPRPPILLGGAAGPTLFRHIVEYGDGWCPMGGGGLRESIPALRALFEDAGRDPDELRVDVSLAADPEPTRLQRYADLGVERVILFLPSAPADVVLPILDGYAALMAG
jgi:probable F420-dependent oxidoreductase